MTAQGNRSSQKENAVSHHIFLFPFKWDCRTNIAAPNLSSFDDCTNLEEFERLLLTNNQWRRKFYSLGADISKIGSNYSEYVYFYDFVRRTIYDIENSEDEPIRYFEYTIGEDANYTIMANRWNKETELTEEDTYKLDLSAICAHAFDTGVGVLSFHLTNYKYKEPEKILRINEYGRRIYPQFLANNDLLTATKSTFLANSICVDVNDGSPIIVSDFNVYTDPAKIWPQVFHLPEHIKFLFPDCFTETNYQNYRPFSECVHIRPVMDDRMFTICWYGNNELANELKLYNENKQEYTYERHTFWYAFLFGDKDSNYPTCQNREMLYESIRKHTYGRWAEYSTFFGVTRDTLMVLSNDISTLKREYAPPINEHVQSMYYQMVNLCLVQRASVLRFMDEINRISRLEGSDNLFFDRINNLYKNYIEFNNRIYFREITSQIQGIEIYDILQNEMRIEKEVIALKEQMSELNQYVELLRQKEDAIKQKKIAEEQTIQAQQATKLSKIATKFLPATLVASALSLLAGQEYNFGYDWNISEIIVLGLMLIILFLSFWFSDKILEKLNIK
ncbi:hypothetical protein ACO2Q8_28780 [Larkinella sp. VNQ87]|uniref:hypothetical protein n=1 Tax=Larkinella sp. VNQ87 TaxID=3400921 RepID=UPI003C101E1C